MLMSAPIFFSIKNQVLFMQFKLWFGCMLYQLIYCLLHLFMRQFLNKIVLIAAILIPCITAVFIYNNISCLQAIPAFISFYCDKNGCFIPTASAVFIFLCHRNTHRE